jgi:uncharacterized protein (TIGR02270 family)
VTIPTVIRRHAEDAATKFWRRSRYLKDPRTSFESLHVYDQTIAAHLDGLREAGSAGIERAQAALERSIKVNAHDVSADCFVVIALAFLTEDMPTMQAVIKQVADKPGFADALEGVFSWFGTAAIAKIVEPQFSNARPAFRHAALRQCHVYDLAASPGLKQALLDSPKESMAITLDAVANCGRTDLLPDVETILSHGDLDEEASFSAARCALLLGERHNAVYTLLSIAAKDSPYSEEAVKLLCMALSKQSLRDHLTELEGQGIKRSLLVKALGWSGNREYIPLLIAEMGKEDTGRLAGEAFRQITGFDIEANHAVAESADDSDDKSPYPLPDAAKLDRWWQDNQQRYADAKLWFFLGRPLSNKWLHYLLGNAEQEHRELAALHRMFLNPGTTLFPTHAGTHRQLQYF